jgi:predicted RNA binding protein YcfA (HicA-like mRNA interferase family)
LSPKLPRLTAKQLIKKLNDNGYILFEVRGSHHHFIHPQEQRKVTIPVHAGKIIGPGLLKAILRQLKLKPEDLLR